MRIAVFGGSFDPVHLEHVRLVRAAIASLGLDRVLVMPSYLAPHKRGGAHADGAARAELCRIAFRGIKEAEVCDHELSQAETSYTYLTCRWLKERYPAAERYFLVGADMLDDFFTWRCPDDILKNVTLAACGRGETLSSELSERFRARFSCGFAEVPFVGEPVSSTSIRVALAFGKRPEGLDEEVFRAVKARGLYEREESRALALEKPERREHSFRVADLACRRAGSLRIPEDKALLAAMLHDCGKYVPPDDPMLAGLKLPPDVPAPVVHQYVGAYLAEHEFKVTDGEILDAIRYHTSGREDMTPLGKLIFLSDMLEEGRRYEGVEELRALFWEDLDRCLCEALRQQLIYLKESGKPVYPLTERAYRWISALENQKN